MPKWVAINKTLSNSFNEIRREYSKIEAMYSLSLDINCGKHRSCRAYSRMWSWSFGKVKRFIENADVDGTATEQQRNSNGTGYTVILLNKQDSAEQQRNSNGTATEHEYKEQDKEKDKNKGNGKFNVFAIRPDWFPENDWNDIVEHRRKHKNKPPETKRAYIGLINQFTKAKEKGLSISDCVDTMTQRGWAGININWLAEEGKGKPKWS